MIPPEGMPPVLAKAFNCAVVAVNPSSLLISDADAVTPVRALSSVCDDVIAPVTLGNVERRVLLINRKWSSACAKPSVEAGFEALRLLTYVPVSSAISGGSSKVSSGATGLAMLVFLGEALVSKAEQQQQQEQPLAFFLKLMLF